MRLYLTRARQVWAPVLVNLNSQSWQADSIGLERPVLGIYKRNVDQGSLCRLDQPDPKSKFKQALF